jgi:hypothetical protein
MRAFLRFAPPVILMGIIFALSAQHHLSSGLGTADLVLRKCAHMTEYALLWLAWRHALGPRISRRDLSASAIAVAYAASDELHQHFVAGRVGSPIDVAIDATGVALAALLRRPVLRWAARRPAVRRLAVRTGRAHPR